MRFEHTFLIAPVATASAADRHAVMSLSQESVGRGRGDVAPHAIVMGGRDGVLLPVGRRWPDSLPLADPGAESPNRPIDCLCPAARPLRR